MLCLSPWVKITFTFPLTQILLNFDNEEVFVSVLTGSAAKVAIADEVNTKLVNAAANTIFVKVFISFIF
jgi:hypothetical protein